MELPTKRDDAPLKFFVLRTLLWKFSLPKAAVAIAVWAAGSMVAAAVGGRLSRGQMPRLLLDLCFLTSTRKGLFSGVVCDSSRL